MVIINKKDYRCNNQYLIESAPPDLFPIKIISNVSDLDREISLILSIYKELGIKHFINFGAIDKGYITITIKNKQPTLDVRCLGIIDTDTKENFINNLDKGLENSISHNMENIDSDLFCRIEPGLNITVRCKIVISDNAIIDTNYFSHKLSYPNKKDIDKDIRYISIHKDIYQVFKNKFRFYFNETIFSYDNLINIMIMVKNAGSDFRHILETNLPFIDTFTILDTGSTDNTIEIIKDVLKNKKGNLFHEPFINFRDSRNRLIELAEQTSDCVFNIMLDDTYVLEDTKKNSVRDILTIARTDSDIESYSVFVKSLDNKYCSNRVLKSSACLRYKYRIHEIIRPNNQFLLPENEIKINDFQSDYMQVRTIDRKMRDLVWLQQDIDDDPDDPKQYYYMAETYLCIKNYEKAFEWYQKRFHHKNLGYIDERFDSIYKSAVIAHLNLGYSFQLCEKLYIEAYNLMPTRPETLFQLGVLYDNVDKEKCFNFLKQSFSIKNHNDLQMNNKFHLTNYHLPNMLIPLCYFFKDFMLGLECIERILNFNDPIINKNEEQLRKWKTIFYSLNVLKGIDNTIKINFGSKELVCFVVDGGWDFFDGSTLEKKGLGGSEAFVINYAENLCNDYDVVVFCKCGKNIVVNGVHYINAYEFLQFISTYNIKVCFNNRYAEYLFACVYRNIPVYFILHDIAISSDIIPTEIKGVLTLTQWHKKQFLETFPMFEQKTHVISYGIDINKFPEKRLKHASFIAPSFPNRGLINTLRMWPKIISRYPHATLNVFIDYNHYWLQQNFKNLIEEIKEIVERTPSIINHGWANPKQIRECWSSSHIWLYTCCFNETFCLCSLECAASDTIAITSNLAALQENVGDRGIMIPGNAFTEEWQNTALEIIFQVLDEKMDVSFLLKKNKEFAISRSFKNVVTDFKNKYIK